MRHALLVHAKLSNVRLHHAMFDIYHSAKSHQSHTNLSIHGWVPIYLGILIVVKILQFRKVLCKLASGADPLGLQELVQLTSCAMLRIVGNIVLACRSYGQDRAQNCAKDSCGLCISYGLQRAQDCG